MIHRRNLTASGLSERRTTSYIPGSLTIEAPDTVRFDLFIDSPYSRGPDGWQKGRYRIFLVRRYLDMAAIIPYVLWITFLAFAVYSILQVAARRLYPWKVAS